MVNIVYHGLQKGSPDMSAFRSQQKYNANTIQFLKPIQQNPTTNFLHCQWNPYISKEDCNLCLISGIKFIKLKVNSPITVQQCPLASIKEKTLCDCQNYVTML